jgi:hypothetical protein
MSEESNISVENSRSDVINLEYDVQEDATTVPLEEVTEDPVPTLRSHEEVESIQLIYES